MFDYLIPYSRVLDTECHRCSAADTCGMWTRSSRNSIILIYMIASIINLFFFRAQNSTAEIFFWLQVSQFSISWLLSYRIIPVSLLEFAHL